MQNFDTDYGNKLYQKFGPINSGDGRSFPVGGSQQWRHIQLWGTPAARSRIVAALDWLARDQYALGNLQFVKRIDCVQIPSKLSGSAIGYPFQVVDPRHPVPIAAKHIFQNCFYNGGWGDAQKPVIEQELRKLEQRLGGSIGRGNTDIQEPVIDVPRRYQREMDETLALLKKIMSWGEFCRYTGSLAYDPGFKTFQQMPNCPACTYSATATIRSAIKLNDLFFSGNSTINRVFILLHEWKHEELWATGNAIGGTQEENICDYFAHNKITQAGYTHTYDSAFTDGLVA